MTLAPIRGAPPGAPIPDFPAESSKQGRASPAPADRPPEPPKRQRGTPIEIRGDGGTFKFTIDPELPAIRRASMTVVVAADAREPCFLRMSAAKAREFLIGLRERRSPLVATGDEGGTVQIKYETTQSGSVFSVFDPGEPGALRGCIVDDIELVAAELLADLGM